MVIVNKKSHFKKVPLLIFQFPSPPTLNNWLSHLLNLYSLVTYLYSSCIHFFVSSHLLLPSLFFFLSQGHMKQKNGSRCPFRWPFRHVSVAVLTLSVPFSAENGLFWPESMRIKKKEGRISTSDSGMATLEPCRWFLVITSSPPQDTFN